jgi:hypothetical protein
MELNGLSDLLGLTCFFQGLSKKFIQSEKKKFDI